MGIDLRSANASAAQLRGYASELRSARDRLSQYCSELNCNWEGREVGYYTDSACSIKRRLEAAASELEAIGRAVSSAADEIRREEEAERRRREEERERQEAEARAAALAAAAARAAGGGGGSAW